MALEGLAECAGLLDFPPDAPAKEAAARVHTVRRRLKWLRSMLRVVRPALSKRAFREADHTLRDAGRCLASARAATARIESLTRLLLHYGVTGARPEEVLGLERTPGVPSRSERERAAELISRATSHAHSWLPDTQAEVLVLGLRDELERTRRAFSRAQKRPSSSRVHEWRKHVKRHWHQLELVRDLEPSLDARIARLDALSELLGDAHDLADLETGLPPTKDSAVNLSALCASREAELTLAALTEGRELFALRPRALRALLEKHVRDDESPHAPRKGQKSYQSANPA